MSSHLINTIAIESRKKKVNFNYKGANERIYKKDINEDKWKKKTEQHAFYAKTFRHGSISQWKTSISLEREKCFVGF